MLSIWTSLKFCHFVNEPCSVKKEAYCNCKKCQHRSVCAVPKEQILGSPKLKEFADANFEFDRNGGEFSRQVENTVGKGEVTGYKQFLLFPQCFQVICTADM